MPGHPWPEHDLDAPRLPDLDILAELGRGAGSVVYRARKQGTDYAVKVLNPAAGDLGAVLTHFRREAALLASVNHPRLPRIHEVGHVGSRPYMVMDLADGRPLTDLIRGGPLSVPRALALILDIVEPLSLMHDQGLVHRDIKPENVMVLPDGSARLIDFGLATREHHHEPMPDAVGTLAYAAPEQAGTLRRPVGNRSDLYSAGVVLFECITGSLPFTSSDVGELLRLHATAPAPDLRELVPVGPGIAAVVASLLAKDPDDRYGSGHALAADLRLLIQDPAAALIPGIAAVPRQTGKLCGRESEVAALMAVWDQARAGRGSTCMLRGSAGIGVTRLAMHIADHARSEGAVTLFTGCHEDDAVPLAPLRAAIDTMLREAEGQPDADRHALHGRIRAAAGNAAPLLAGLSPALAAVLGTVLGTGPLPDGDRQHQFAASVAGFIAELARMCGGMVFIIDDVHVADPATLRVLTALAVHVRQAPILCIGTARSGWENTPDQGPHVVAARAQHELDLTIGPLDDAGIADLVTTRLPGIDLGSVLASLLTTRCQGNPFITLEYLRAVVDAGLLRPHWGSWVLDTDGLSALALPQDALGLVLARLGGLDDEARQLLVVAAAIGTSFHPDVVAQVSAVDSGLAMTAMARAASLHLVGVREAGDYEFLHARIREALLDGLTGSYLTDLHQTIAEVLDQRYHAGAPHTPGPGTLDPGQIFAMAGHYLLGDPRRSIERAYQVCRRAGQLSMASHAPAQAVTYLEHADRLRPGDPHLLYLLGTAHQRDGSYSPAVACCTQALAAERDPLRRARILLLVTEIERSRWNVPQAEAAVRQGLAELGRPIPATAVRQAFSFVLQMMAGVFVGLTGWRFGTAEGEERERDALTVALHDAGAYVATIAMRPGRRLLHHVLGLLSLNRLGAGPDYTVAVSGLGLMLSALGLPKIGGRLMDEGESAARQLGDPHLLALCEWEKGAREYLTGRDDGQRWERSVLEHGHWLDAGHISDSVASIAWEAVVMGRVADAQDWFQRGQQLVDLRSTQEITSLITVGVVTASAQGRAIEAAAELRRITPLLENHSGPGLRLNLVLAQLHTLAEQGELGPPFEVAAQQFFALQLNPRVAIRQHRLFHVVHTFGRLAQCRALAGSPALAEALGRARTAVVLLRRSALTSATRAFAQVAQAQLEVLENQPQAALKRLARIQPWSREAPILSYELACTTARAMAAAGFRAQARDQARLACVVAQDAGLTRRARWAAEEFSTLTRGGGGSGSRSSVQPSTSLNARAAGVDRQRLQALQDISRAAAKVLDPDELARICLDRTLRILSAQRAVLFLADDPDEPATTSEPTSAFREPLRPHLSRDANGRDVPELTGYSASLVERVRETREPIVITGTDEGAALGAQSVVLHGLRSIMVAPLLLEGRLLGVVYLDSQIAKGIFTAEDADILLALMTHIATSLETARAAQLQVSVRTAQQQRDLAEALHQALAEMSAALEPSDVLARLLTSVQTVLPGTNAWLIPESSETLHDQELRAILDGGEPIHGTAPLLPPAALTQLIGDAATWTVLPLRTGGQLGTDPAESSVPPAPSAVPGGPVTIGLLVLAAQVTATRADAQGQVAGVLATQAMTAYDRAALFARVQELAVVDDLTQIPNRRRFFEVAERDFTAARRHGRTLQAMMIDIDHFKAINDNHGHAIGDQVIRVVAERLNAEIREIDVLGRYGGEEFALVLPDTPDDADGAEIAERLRRAVEETPVLTARGAIAVTVSAGLTAMQESDLDIGAVLARADQQLYRAKAAGRNQVAVG